MNPEHQALNKYSISQEIALKHESKKDRTLMRYIFGVGKRVGSVPASDLIHPFSPFARVVTSLSGIFLLYTCVVTPFVLGFFWDADACYKLPILEFDMVNPNP